MQNGQGIGLNSDGERGGKARQGDGAGGQVGVGVVRHTRGGVGAGPNYKDRFAKS